MAANPIENLAVQALRQCSKRAPSQLLLPAALAREDGVPLPSLQDMP